MKQRTLTNQSKYSNQNGLLAPPKITQAAIHSALNGVALESLKPLSAGLAILYFFLSFRFFFIPPETAQGFIVSITAGTAIIFLILWSLFNYRKMPDHLAHPIGAFVGGLVTVNVLLRLYLLHDINQTNTIFLIVVGIGFLVLSLRWVLFLISAIVIAWGVVVTVGLPNINIFDAGLPLISAIVVSIIVHLSRTRTYERLETLRLQDNYQKEQLHMLYQNEMSRRQLAETLYQVGHAMTGTLDLNKVLDLILENLAEIVFHHRGAVLLEQGSELEMVSARGFPREVPTVGLRIPLKENDVYDEILRLQDPLNIADVSTWGTWQQVNGLPQTYAWMGVPLKRRDKIIGMLSLAREIPQAYTQEEVTLAATFADRAAIALDNARLYDELTRFNRDLERLVEKRTEDLQMAYAIGWWF